MEDPIRALRELRLSGARIASMLGLAERTVRAMLGRAGLSRLPAPDAAAPARRYERPTPGEPVHIEVKKLGRIERPGHRMHGDRTTRPAAPLSIPARLRRRLHPPGHAEVFGTLLREWAYAAAHPTGAARTRALADYLDRYALDPAAQVGQRQTTCRADQRCCRRQLGSPARRRLAAGARRRPPLDAPPRAPARRASPSSRRGRRPPPRRATA